MREPSDALWPAHRRLTATSRATADDEELGYGAAEDWL
jgi:hypothetical protein